MPSPPEHKQLKDYGIIKLRTFKPTNRLGFKYLKGKHQPTGKQVFIKLDPSSGQIAAREATLLKILNDHPYRVHFPLLVAHKPRGRNAFVATEFIPGTTLKVFLTKQAPLTAAQTNSILEQLVRILDVLHKKRIIHRDIRPQNLMVSLAGGKPLLLLIDFAFAVALKPNPLPELPFLLARPQLLRRLGGSYRAAADFWDDAYSIQKIAQLIAPDYRRKYPLVGQALDKAMGRLTFPYSPT
ncbi:protein kinase domain-containing protein [Capillibacterium thermochitinicola]|uniref:Protein kinase n=1 Tax=Capillibacterium thermochitinicola TaxID=2699427 RepID=A0A8J6LRT0_9FIRM|nr:protein kinase [Capillibacterium thermochitinicola]MBA2132467.1 protein kinase [Capillibacterium thermochitinicola]